MRERIGSLEFDGQQLNIQVDEGYMFAILGIRGVNGDSAALWLEESEIPELIYLLNKAKGVLHEQRTCG